MPRKRADLSGQRFGRLVAISETSNKVGKSYTWLCKCDCGNEKEVVSRYLTSNSTRSCGCLLEEAIKNNVKYLPNRTVDLVGKRFDRLVVVEKCADRYVSPNGDTQLKWLCKCDCGGFTEVTGSHLKHEDVRSCGCLYREINVIKGKNIPRNTLDLTNKRFGNIVAIKEVDERTSDGRIVWSCRCDCGNNVDVRAGSLVSGNTKSCGCLGKVIFDGMKFGRLAVVSKSVSKSGYWTCKCLCGEVKDIFGNNLLSGKTRSCGCIVKEKCGENHPNYNPNLTDEQRIKHRYVLGKHTYKAWRKRVYERDDYTCRACLKRGGGRMNAHHLDGWNWCIERRYDVENGVTLCENCHKNFHLQYGYGENTASQFETFLIESKTTQLI